MKFGCRNKDHSLIWAFSVIVKSLQTFVSSSIQQVTNPDTEQQTDMKQRHFHAARWHLIIKCHLEIIPSHIMSCTPWQCWCRCWAPPPPPYALYSLSVFLCTIIHVHFPFHMFWYVLTFFEGCTWSCTWKWTWAAPGVWSGGSAWRGRCEWLGAMGGLGSLQHYNAHADQIPEVCEPWRLWPPCQDCAQTELSMPQGDTYI